MNEEQESNLSNLVSDVKRVELIICPTCDGNGKVYPPNPNNCDVNPVICITCKGR